MQGKVLIIYLLIVLLGDGFGKPGNLKMETVYHGNIKALTHCQQTSFGKKTEQL